MVTATAQVHPHSIVSGSVMFCCQCGIRLPELARFCPACGNAVSADSSPPGTAAPGVVAGAEPAGTSSWRYILIGVTTGLVILLLAGGWLAFEGKLAPWFAPRVQQQSSPGPVAVAESNPADIGVEAQDLTPDELQAARTALDEAIAREERAGQRGRTHPTATADTTDNPVVKAPAPKYPVPTPPAPTHPVVRTAGGPGTNFPSTDDYYPPASARLAESGTATVHVCTDATGQLAGNPIIQQGSGSPRLDEGALKLAKAGSGHYKPATEDGTPVASCFGFRVKFQMRN